MMEDTEDREGLTTENLAETVMKAEEEDRNSNSAEIKTNKTNSFELMRMLKSLENLNPFGNVTPEEVSEVLVKVLSIPVIIYTFFILCPIMMILVLIRCIVSSSNRFASVMVEGVSDYGCRLVEAVNGEDNI